MFMTVSPDLPPSLTEHVHHYLGVAGLFVLRTVLLSIFYYVIFRLKLGYKLFQPIRQQMYRVFGRTSAQADGGVSAGAEVGSLIAILVILTLPLALTILVERYLFRIEKNYIVEGVLRLNEVDRLLRDDFPTIYGVLAVFATLFAYWSLNYFRELLVCYRRRKGGRRWLEAVKEPTLSLEKELRPCGDGVKRRRKVGRTRRRVSSQLWYYLLLNTMAITVMFTLVSTLTGRKNLTTNTVSVTAMAESPLKARIQSLSDKAGVGTVTVEVAHVSGQTSAMNASGNYWVFGPRIIIEDTTLDHLSEKGLIFVVAHELYHVRQIPAYVVVVTSTIILIVILLIAFGPPRRRRYARAGELTADELTKQFALAAPRYLR
jgi:Zn-dependent protease with chaperone function